MKKCILGIATLMLAFAPIGAVAYANPPIPQARQMKIVLSRQSNVDPVEIMKHLSRECPNVTLTTNPRNSDFMVNAVGWSGNYRFMVIRHGGDTIYATETALLSNSVKDVCHFLNTRAPAGPPPPPPAQAPPPPPPPAQAAPPQQQ